MNASDSFFIGFVLGDVSIGLLAFVIGLRHIGRAFDTGYDLGKRHGIDEHGISDRRAS